MKKITPITDHEIIQDHFDQLIDIIKEDIDYEDKRDITEHMSEIYRRTYVLKELIKIIYR